MKNLTTHLLAFFSKTPEKRHRKTVESELAFAKYAFAVNANNNADVGADHFRGQIHKLRAELDDIIAAEKEAGK